MSSVDDVPFTQWAGIHRNHDFFSFEPLSGYRRSLREDECFILYLEPDATEESLGKALLEMLDRSRFVDPDVEPGFFDMDRALQSEQRWLDDFMKRFRYKTMREAYKNLDYCRAKRRNGTISIKPYGRDKPGFIKYLPEDRAVVIPATKDPLVAGAALKLALRRCV